MPERFLATALRAPQSFELPPDPIARQLCERLTDIGIIVETTPSKLGSCPHCGAEKPLLRAPDGTAFIRCLDGDIVIPKDSIRRWTVHRPSLCEFLCRQLNLTETRNANLAGVVSNLGRYAAGNGGFPVWLIVTFGLPERLIIAQSNLMQRSPAETGIIICDDPIGLANYWPRTSKSVLLDELFKINRENVVINQALFMSAAPKSKTPMRKTGRPKKNELLVMDVFVQRVLEGKALTSSCRDEAKAIAALEAGKFGFENARAWTSIRNLLAPHWKCWADQGFSATYMPSQNSE